MIGPASRRHFMKALQAADEAERNMVPGHPVDRVLKPLALALISAVRGIAFAFLQDEVTIKPKEDS